MKEPSVSRVNHRVFQIARTNIIFACLEFAYGIPHRDPDPGPQGVQIIRKRSLELSRVPVISRVNANELGDSDQGEGSWNCRSSSSESRAIDHTHRGSLQFARRTYKGARTHLLHMHVWAYKHNAGRTRVDDIGWRCTYQWGVDAILCPRSRP